MVNQSPTALATPADFQAGDDASNPSMGRYYVTDENYPWAIDIPFATEYMYETNDIVTGHLRFAQWAQSGGTVFSDWYLQSVGYKDSSKLYPAP